MMDEHEPETGKRKESTATQSDGAASTNPIGQIKIDGDGSQQLEFLYKTLDDAQSTIRFLDAKAAFGIALLAAMIEKTLTEHGMYVPWDGHPTWREALFLAFALCSSLSIAVVARILFPVSNPARNVSVSAPTTPPFYIADLRPKRWQRFLSTNPSFSRLFLPQSELASAVRSAGTDTLLNALATEVLKVSYIRQIKMDRLRAFACLLAATAALFAGLMVTNAAVPQQPTVVPVKLQPPVTISAAPITPQPSVSGQPCSPKPSRHRKATPEQIAK